MTAAAAIEPGPAAPAAGGVLSPERRLLTVGLVMVITMAAFEALAVATVMPRAKDDIGGVAIYGWAFSAFLLASLVGISWAGPAADRLGPAKPFALGISLFGAGLLVGGFAPSMWVLVIGRAIQGLGAGTIPAIAYTAIGRGYEESQRPRMFALFATAWVIPGLIGPVIAGAVAEWLSWRLVFLGLVPLLAVGGILPLRALAQLGPPEVPSAAAAKMRLVLVLVIAATLVVGASATDAWWQAAPLVVAGLAVGVPALVKVLPAGTLRAGRGLPAAIGVNSALNFAFFGADVLVPLTLVDVRGQSAVVGGLVLTGATISWTAGTWTQERAIDKRVSRPLMAATGLVVMAAGALLTTLIAFSEVPVWWAAVSWSVAGYGIGLAYPTLSLVLMSHAPKGEEGRTASSMKLAEQLATALGAGAAGAFIAIGAAAGSQSTASAAGFITFGAIGLAAIILTPRLIRRE